MSYILDALKKSEQERGHGTAPGVQTIHSSSLNYHQEKRTVWPWFLAAIVTINLAAIIYFIQTNDISESVEIQQLESGNEIVNYSEPVITTTAPVEETPTVNVTTTRQPLLAQHSDIEEQVIYQTETIEPIFDTVDFYDLPLNVRQHIPAMEFSAHVYSSNPVQRSIVINGRFMEEGSQVSNELILSEITSDGAIFEFRGYRFNTSVLSGWD